MFFEICLGSVRVDVAIAHGVSVLRWCEEESQYLTVREVTWSR